MIFDFFRFEFFGDAPAKFFDVGAAFGGIALDGLPFVISLPEVRGGRRRGGGGFFSRSQRRLRAAGGCCGGGSFAHLDGLPCTARAIIAGRGVCRNHAETVGGAIQRGKFGSSFTCWACQRWRRSCAATRAKPCPSVNWIMSEAGKGTLVRARSTPLASRSNSSSRP
jgi:hypothetical protein